MIAIDMTEWDAALDERDYNIFQSYDERLAAALEVVVRRGASLDAVKQSLRGRPSDDRLIARVPGATRHLRRMIAQEG